MVDLLVLLLVIIVTRLIHVVDVSHQVVEPGAPAPVPSAVAVAAAAAAVAVAL
jgi:hypothetical protein